MYYDSATGEYIFDNAASVSPNLQRVSKTEFQNVLLSLEKNDQQKLLGGIRLKGRLSVAAYDMVERQLETELQLLNQQLPYSFEVLSSVDDFRILVGLQYLIEFARQLGVSSKLDPVLSFPLGANVVTLLETTRIYEGLVTGKVSTFGYENEEDKDVLAVLDRIESASGEVLYRPHKQVRTVVDAKTSLALGHILENVVKYGTGRQADKDIRLNDGKKQQKSSRSVEGKAVPLLGKTGTANRYTNASFYGYLPGLAEDGGGMVVKDGYTVGVYVGYDDNKVMQRSSTRITGAAGALPAWIDIVEMLLREKDYAGKLNAANVSFGSVPLRRDNIGQFNFAADAEQGGILSNPAQIVHEENRSQPSIMTFGQQGEGGETLLSRTFQPFWRSEEATPTSL